VGRSPETFDLLISCTAHELPGFERETLCSDTEVVVVRAGHPARSRLTTRDGFLAASHIAVVGRGLRDDPFDDWLRQQGLVERISWPSFRTAWRSRRRNRCRCRSTRRPGAYDEYLFYPRRTKRDPASMWLREVTQAVRAGGEPSEDVLHPV
jgi:hypothetical protein